MLAATPEPQKFPAEEAFFLSNAFALTWRPRISRPIYSPLVGSHDDSRFAGLRKRILKFDVPQTGLGLFDILWDILRHDLSLLALDLPAPTWLETPQGLDLVGFRAFVLRRRCWRRCRRGCQGRIVLSEEVSRFIAPQIVKGAT